MNNEPPAAALESGTQEAIGEAGVVEEGVDGVDEHHGPEEEKPVEKVQRRKLRRFDHPRKSASIT